MTTQNPELPWRILNETPCTLGEGPTYDPHTNTAWWFDVLGRKLFEHRFDDAQTIVRELPFVASALARIDAGRQLVWTENGLYIRDVASGAFTLHVAIEEDNAITRSNDARVHPSGAFWVGSMGFNAEHEAGSIYHYRAGKVQKIFDKISITNAICFSPDGTVGYFTDTKLGQIMRVKLDAATGLPTAAPETFITEFLPNSSPDGAVTDAEGNIWVALWGIGTVAGYSPDGSLIENVTITLPASQVTCPAFVGKNVDSMLVTSGHVGLSDPEPTDLSGITFIVDLPFRGRHEPDVVLG